LKVTEKDRIIRYLLTFKNLFKENISLSVILFLTIFFHLFLISNVPPVVFTDEIDPFVTVSSLLLHHGIKFISGPYEPFSLLVMTLNLEWQSIILFGNTTFTIRFPGLIFSFFLVFSVYFLFLHLFNRKTALWGSLLVSISPAVIQGGRVFYQIPIIAGTLFLTAGIYLILRGWKKSNKMLFLVGVLLISFDIGGYLNIYSRFLGIVILIVIFGRLLLTDKIHILKNILIWMVPAVIVLYLIIILIPNLSISSSAASAHTLSYYISSNENLLFRGVGGFEIFFTKYIAYFSPKFLFLTGDINPTANTGLTGEFLFPSIVFFYLGIVISIFKIFKYRN
jgi:4-amino-4-deoxy-L-arabinose transferase-like glycosyltransferase